MSAERTASEYTAQAVARSDQVIDRHARGQRVAGQLGRLVHGAALDDPVLVDTPFQLAEQAPGLIIEAAVEIGLGVGTVVAVIDAAEQAQIVGQAQGVLDFQVVAGFPGALVDIAAYHFAGAGVPLVPHLSGEVLEDRVAVGRRVVGLARHLLGVVGVQLPQAGQLGAEGDFGIAGAPYLLAVPVLGGTLYVQAVTRIEVDVPAHRAGVVLGVDIGVVAAFGDIGEYGRVGVGPLVAAFLGRQLPVDALARVEGMAGADVEAVEAAAVAVVVAGPVAVEAVVLHAGQRQAQVPAVPAHALAGVEIVDAALAAGDLDPRAMAVGRAAGEDIDHSHQRVGAVTDGVGATEHFDALDIFHGQRDIAPVHRRQARAVHRATVDQHLHASGVVDVTAVVVDGRLVAGTVADHHPRHQPQQFGDVAGAAGLDQLAVEHGHAARYCRRGLFEASGGQYLWQGLAVDEQVVGHGRAAEQGGQQQQRMWGARA